MNKEDIMKTLKQKTYALIFWRTPCGEILSNISDIYHHLKFSFNNNSTTDKKNLEFYLTKQYHIVEKGLALPSPRPGFGREKIRILLDKGYLYIDKYGASQLTSSIAQCFIDYIAFNEKVGYHLDSALKSSINNFINKNELTHSGGSKDVTSDNIKRLANMSFDRMVTSRHSIRNFSKTPVPIDTIKKCVDLAKFAPSVCNRQAWQAHYYSDQPLMKKLLTIQNGNGGFTDSITGLLIVTGDIKGFTRYESNQLFVDGGLFAMNLMLSLHYKGLGSCPLNTCFPYLVENKVKKIAGISKNERLIMMIAVGNLKDSFKVAVSERRATDTILKFH